MAGTSSVTVTWPASADPTVTGYRVVADPGPATCATTTTTCVLGAVAGVTYTYTVIARSAAGDSDPSIPSNAVTAVAPTTPAAAPATNLGLTTDHGSLPVAAPGSGFVVIGSGYAAHSTVTLTIYSSPTSLGRVTTDSAGGFRKQVSVPVGFAGQRHSVVALGAAPDGSLRTMKLTFRVTATKPLPTTGPAVVWQTLSALLAIAVGLTLRRFAAPRRRPAGGPIPPAPQSHGRSSTTPGRHRRWS